MSKLGNDLIESLTVALAHARGESSGVRVYRVKTSSPRWPRRRDERVKVCPPAANAARKPRP